MADELTTPEAAEIPWWLVFPRDPSGDQPFTLGAAKLFQAPTSQAAAAHAYNDAVVVACDVFPRPGPTG